jgi:hypothetical protein
MPVACESYGTAQLRTIRTRAGDDSPLDPQQNRGAPRRGAECRGYRELHCRGAGRSRAETQPLNQRGTGARIVRYVVEASGQVEILIPYGLYRRMLRAMRRYHVQDTPDEVVAEAVRVYLRDRVAEK